MRLKVKTACIGVYAKSEASDLQYIEAHGFQHLVLHGAPLLDGRSIVFGRAEGDDGV